MTTTPVIGNLTPLSDPRATTYVGMVPIDGAVSATIVTGSNAPGAWSIAPLGGGTTNWLVTGPMPTSLSSFQVQITASSEGTPTASDPYFNYVAFLTHFEGAVGLHALVDASSHAWASATPGALSATVSKYGATSLDPSVFTPSSDATVGYGYSLASAGLLIGTQDFTLEGYVYLTSLTAGNFFFGQWFTTGGGECFSIGTSPTDGSALALFLDNAKVAQSPSGTLVTGQWYHVALERDNRVLTLYLDGSVVYTAANTTYFHASGNWLFGNNGVTASSRTTGFIDECRLTIGVPRYTQPFTPPTAAFPDTGASTGTDPYFADVVLLSHFDGAGGTTDFNDDSGHCVLTAVGGATGAASLPATLNGQTVTSPAPRFGAQMLYLTGASQYVTVTPAVTGALIVAGDFTLEWSSNSFSAAGTHFYVSSRFQFANGRLLYVGANKPLVFGDASFYQNQWVDWMICRAANTLFLFINGELNFTASNWTDVIDFSTLQLGCSPSGLYPFVGALDEVRLTKGAARHVDTYAPATAAFPNSGPLTPSAAPVFTPDPYFANVILLASFDGPAGSTSFNDFSGSASLDPVGQAQIATVQPTTNAVGTMVTDSGPLRGIGSLYLDGSSAVTVTPNTTSTYQLAADFTLEFWYNGVISKTIWSTPTVPAGETTTYGGLSMTGRALTNVKLVKGGVPIANSTLRTWTMELLNEAQNAGVKHFMTLQRRGAVLMGFVDGKLVACAFCTQVIDLSQLLLGNTVSGTTGFIGMLDEVRLTTGVARYNAEFTPPTGAFANSGPTTLPAVPTFRQDPYFYNVALLLHFTQISALGNVADTSALSRTCADTGLSLTLQAQDPFGGTRSSLRLVSQTCLLVSTQTVAADGVTPVLEPTMDFSTQDFTVEFFVYFASGAANAAWTDLVLATNNASNTPFTFRISLKSGNLIAQLCNQTDGTASIYLGNNPVSSKLSASTWYHIALVRSASRFMLYLNGVCIDTATYTGALYMTGLTGLYLGGNPTPAQCMNGLLAEFRITSGVARYLATQIVVPTAPFPNVGPLTAPAVPRPLAELSDSAQSSVVLMAHFEGANASTTLVDTTGRCTLTPHNGAQLTTQAPATLNGQTVTNRAPKFGVSALMMVGGTEGTSTGTQVSINATTASDLVMGGDFTIEWWSNAMNTGSQIGTLWTSNGLTLSMSQTSASLVDNTATMPTITWTPTPATDFFNWEFFVVQRAGTTVLVLRNGALVGYQSNAASIDLTNLTLGVAGTTHYYSGEFDELRITKGVSRYVTGGLPPSRPFPDTAPVADPYFSQVGLLLRFDTLTLGQSNALKDSSSFARTLVSSGDKISTIQTTTTPPFTSLHYAYGSAAGGGAYVLDGTTGLTLATDVHMDISGGDFTLEAFVYVGNASLLTQQTLFQVLTLNSDNTVTNGWAWILAGNGSLNVNFPINNTSAVTCGAGSNQVCVLPSYSWTHVAVVRSGSSFKAYLNGVATGLVGSYSGALLALGSTFAIGGFGLPSGGSELNPLVMVDEFRLTKGRARYTSNFTPPTAIFPGA